MQVTGTSYLSLQCTISWPHSVTPSLLCLTNQNRLQYIQFHGTPAICRLFSLWKPMDFYMFSSCSGYQRVFPDQGYILQVPFTGNRAKFISNMVLASVFTYMDVHCLHWCIALNHKMFSRSYVLYISLIYALHYATIQAVTWHYIMFHYINNNNYTNTYYNSYIYICCFCCF